MFGLSGLAIEALLLAMAVEFIGTMMGTSVSTISPQISKALGSSDIFIGIYTGAFYAGCCLSSLTVGNFTRKYGAALITGLGLLITAGAMLMCSIPIFWIAVVSGFILGLGKGPLMPAINTMVSAHITKAQTQRVFAVKQCIGPIGFITSGALLPVVAKYWGWQACLWGLAIGSVLVAIFAFLSIRAQDTFKVKDEKISIKKETESIGLVFSVAPLRRLCYVSFIYKGLQMCVTAYLVVFLAKQDFSLIFAGLMLSCTSLGAIFGRLLWGWQTDKVGTQRMLGIIGILMGAFTIWLTFVGPETSPWLVVVISILLGMNSLGWDGIFFGQIASIVPSDRVAEATGGADFFNFMGAIVVPVAFGFLGSELQDYRPGFWIAAGATILTGLILLFSRKMKLDKTPAAKA